MAALREKHRQELHAEKDKYRRLKLGGGWAGI